MKHSPLVFAGIAAALVVAVVNVTYRASAPPFREHIVRTACTVIGDVRTESAVSSYSCAQDRGGVLAVTGAHVRTGEHVVLRGRLEPFDAPRNPGEPDEREIERERGRIARMSSAYRLATLPPASATPAVELARIQSWALDQFRARLPEPSASILAGELWGERAALPPDLRTEFQETGTVHVLVTAGLHFGVVSAIVLMLLRACRLPRVVCCAAAIALLWCYAIFSGLHVPAVRAATMVSFGLTAYAAGAAPLSWNAFGAALLGIAILDPLAITGASFALSFSCVGAILLAAGPLRTALEKQCALPQAISEALSLAVATQLGTWPLTAAIFSIFAPYAVLANLLVVPAVGVTMIFGAAQLLCASVAPLAQALANTNGWLLEWIVGCVHAVSSLPAAAIAMSRPPLWTIVAYDAAFVAAVYCWKRGAPTAAIALAAAGAAIVVAPPVMPDHRLRIIAIDVGQADALLIQTPLGHALLVDAGGRLERGVGSESSAELVGERTVVPLLHRLGVRRIDAFILSHPHGDHAGGMAPVLRSFRVTEIADSGQRYGGFAYNDALQTARVEQVPILHPRASVVWRTEDGVTLTFIGPSLPFIESNNTINDNSIAFILQYKHFRMTFTGDAGVAAEQRFLSEGIDLHADVLKVGHHGSAYSSSAKFLDAVHPKYAIISVGRHNLFGHPAPSTIQTLQRYGAQIYRTDQNGATTIITDGRVMQVRSML